MLLVNASAGRSRIHGKGLIARELVPAGALVWVLKKGFDVELTKDQFEELAPIAREQVARYVYTDVATGNYILCSDDAKYMNHSDTPNTRTEGNQTTAIADIQPGQEITCNYYEFDAATRQSTVLDWNK
ncbi:MAG: SET domain-containing protein [Deltaproteobacteria bacterium]